MVWKIGKILMENHECLYFQLAFLQTFTLHLIQIRIQDNTTMEFQQNINFDSITDEIWEFLVWYEIFSYECPCLARDWPEIRNSVSYKSWYNTGTAGMYRM